MGFFSGLVGGLLGGGGSTKQTSTNTNTTNVDVEIENIINVESLAQVLEGIKSIFAKSEADQTELQKLTLATLVADAQAETEQRDILGGIGKSFKILTAGILAFLFWQYKKKRKGKRKK